MYSLGPLMASVSGPIRFYFFVINLKININTQTMQGKFMSNKLFQEFFSKAFDRVRHCLLLDKMSGDIEPARCGCVLTFLLESRIF
jgi:hypothetical protein